MKIIVIGAGIAGLTFALACKRAGLDVNVFDKTKKLRSIGGGILLWPHGMRYLEWMGLSDTLKPYQISVTGCKISDINGNIIFREKYAPLYSLIGGEILPIDRHVLHQSLLKQLSPSSIHFGKECLSVECDEKEARVRFTDGSLESADLIVGADGIYSNVRQYIHADREIEYTNTCWWGGIIAQHDVPALATDEVYIALGLGKMCIVWPTHGEKFMWYLPVKMASSAFESDSDGNHQLMQICADWTPEVRQIITAPASAQRFHLPIHCLSTQSKLSNHRMTLIGDAAHAIGPILGLGASQAIEDAFVLANCLTKTDDELALQLALYEALRVTKSTSLYALENASSNLMMCDNKEAMRQFQQEIQALNMAEIYQDLIPFIDEAACHQLADAVAFSR